MCRVEDNDGQYGPSNWRGEMTMKGMEYVDRYIYAVTQKLPEKQRSDIEKELRGLIEDMLEERVNGEEITQQHVEEVLLELGNPSELADQYRGYRRYLIGPEMFPSYWMILKIVLVAIGIAMTVVFMIDMVMEPKLEVTNVVGDYIISIIDTLVQGFVWVTIVFAIIEYSGLNSKKKLGIDTATKSWKPSMLADIPDPSTKIKKSDSIASLLFTVFFGIIFIFSIELISVYFSSNGSFTRIPIFDAEVVRGYLPFGVGVLALFMMRDILKLVVGKWTVKVGVVSIAANVIWWILALFLFNDQLIWNPTFMEELAQVGVIMKNNADLEVITKIWDINKVIWIYIVSLAVIFESVWIAYKVYRSRGHLRN